MSQNFFTALIATLNKVSTKNKLVDEILMAQENIESMGKIFTEEKIDSLIQESVLNVNDIMGIYSSLLSYKYRLSHDKKKRYNSNSEEETEGILLDINKALSFMDGVIEQKINNLKTDENFSNFLIKIYFNENVQEKLKLVIEKNIQNLSFNKHWINEVYWLNVPIGKVTKNIMNPKMLSQLTVGDLIALGIKKESKEENGHEYFPGVVLIEVLIEKLKNTSISYDELERFMNSKALNASFMNSRQIPVCKMMMDLASLIRKNLSDDEIEKFDESFVKKNFGFSTKDIFIFSVVGSMTEKQILRFSTCAVTKKNVESLKFFLNTMHIRVEDSEKDPTVESSLSIIAHSGYVKSYIIEIRNILASYNISLKEDDFISVLITSEAARSEEFKESMQEWALDIVLENSIPKIESSTIKKASVKF